MRDCLGDHVTAVDKYGSAANDNVAASASVHGHFAVAYAEYIEMVCIEVNTNGPTYAGMSMQLTVDKAITLRGLLDDAIADALAATVVPALPAEGGAA